MILLDPDLDPDLAPRSAANSAPGDPLPSTRSLNAFLRRAQAAVRLRGEVSILLTSDEQIKKLNRQFRGKNKATDVLSFPAEPGPEKLAGDLAISIPTARNQGTACGHSLGTELKVLILHGLLHLAGFDHETDRGEMARRERQLRARLNLPLGLIERTTDPGWPILAPASGRKGGKPQFPARARRTASRREATKIAPDEVRSGTRRTQSGERRLNAVKPRRGDRNSLRNSRSRT